MCLKAFQFVLAGFAGLQEKSWGFEKGSMGFRMSFEGFRIQKGVCEKLLKVSRRVSDRIPGINGENT